MSSRKVDVVVVGLGLAGSCLAWELSQRRLDFVLIDGGLNQSASMVSAGLMTPITGKRLVKSWRWDEFWAVACNFYHQVAPECFQKLNQLRLFRSDTERNLFADGQIEHDDLVASAQPEIPSNVYSAPWGGFEMKSGRLHVRSFVEQTADHFADHIQHVALSIEDIQLTGKDCEIGSLELRARHVIFCQGLQGGDSPWFPLRFNPAKGQILKLSIPDLDEARVINGGVWLARDPDEPDCYRCGATYEWKELDTLTTTRGRQELEDRLKGFLKVPFQVVDQIAGVRPALADSRPFCGVHPQHPQLAILNGLGSKGALQGPLLARHLVQTLIGDTVNDPDFYRASMMNSL